MNVKEDIVKELNKLYNDSNYAVVLDFKGLNAADTSAFRGDLRTKCNCSFLVVKNTLNKIGAKGTSFEKNVDFKGQCGVIFCDDLLKVSKVVNDFCFKTNKVKFISCLNKSDICSEEQIKELASLPSIEVLRTKLLYVLNSVGSSVVRAMAERVKQQGGELGSDSDCSL